MNPQCIGRTEFNKHLPFIKWLTGLPYFLAGQAKWKNVLFLAACCERQFGNYARFHQEAGWGNPQALCHGIRALWSYTDAVEVTNLTNIQQAIEKVTPDTEDFTSVYTSSALDAAVSLIESLGYCVDNDISHYVQVASLCRDSIYVFIQARDHYDYSALDEAKTYADPLMTRELEAQRSDIEWIISLSEDSTFTAARARRGCDPEGGSLS